MTNDIFRKLRNQTNCKKALFRQNKSLVSSKILPTFATEIESARMVPQLLA